jgi:hypothetical protein
MKYALFLTLICSTSFAMQKTCLTPKIKYLTKVEVIDEKSFFSGCKGEVIEYTIECKYYVDDLCNGAAGQYFDEKDLKIISNRT